MLEDLRYHIKLDGQDNLFTLPQAGAAFNQGMLPVAFGSLVVRGDGSIRPMTAEDEKRILADTTRDSEYD